MVCLECGNNFFKQRRHQTYCSRKCRNRANGRKSYKPKALQKQTCQVCHDTFKAKHKRSTCSKQCRIKLDGIKRREAGKLRKANMSSEKYARVRAQKKADRARARQDGRAYAYWDCVTCGERFKCKRYSEAGYWCTNRCRADWHTLPKESSITFYSNKCRQCGSQYVTAHIPNKYCSSRCCYIARPKHKWINPRARLAIYERDLWVCHICGDQVPKELQYSTDEYNPLYPSLDHITPRAHGGSNNPDNLKLAHVYCNSIRRDTPL